MTNRFFSRYREIIPDYSDFLEALQQPLPAHVRVNRLKASPEAVTAEAADEGVRLVRSHPTDDTLFMAGGSKTPGNLTAYFLGHLHPQALTSCLATKALSPTPGALVLDLCAAPGGKAAHAAALMKNGGLLVANDLHTGRHPALAHNLARLGVLNAVLTAYQAQQFPRRQLFDFVLADVPCTGEGGFRAVKGRTEPIRGPRAANLPALQKLILERGFDLLEPGGVLVYATCTYNPEENEAVVDHLLRRRDAAVLPLAPDVPCEPGLTAWRKERYDARMELTRRFYPHRVDSVGFYLARLGRRG
ncbi:MAG: RsmB/NOP family class I SAM-dependent RNA methyltransferase [Deltaproteobacteria bacterium]|nr:RsmB/NOP family class I SAM-dependent RNA methyltransferase [Deltaproteobacteria bacterium]